MLLQKLMADVEARAGVSKAFQMILGVSLLTNVLMAGGFLAMDTNVRTIMVPPEINKTFWVDGRALGPEYMEQMGAWVISQFATVSPTTIEFQNANLLKYVHPSAHGELAMRFQVGANRLKSENMSKIFSPREIRLSEKGQAVAMIGVQSTWIADKRVPNDQQKGYLVSFAYSNGRTYIKELRETNPEHAFEAPSASALSKAEADAAAQPSGAALQPVSGLSAPNLKTPDGNAPAAQVPALPPAPPQPANPAVQESLQSGNAPAPIAR